MTVSQRANGHDEELPVAVALEVEDAHGEIGVLAVAPSQALQVWPHARAFIRSAQNAMGEDFSDLQIVRDLIQRRVLLWLIYEGRKIIGAGLTQLKRGKDGTVCQILAVGGVGMKRWIQVIKHIEAYAEAERCVKVRIEGRIGWERVLPDYQRTGVIIEKGL